MPCTPCDRWPEQLDEHERTEDLIIPDFCVEEPISDSGSESWLRSSSGIWSINQRHSASPTSGCFSSSLLSGNRPFRKWTRRRTCCKSSVAVVDASEVLRSRPSPEGRGPFTREGNGRSTDRPWFALQVRGFDSGSLRSHPFRGPLSGPSEFAFQVLGRVRPQLLIRRMATMMAMTMMSTTRTIRR